MNVLLRPCMDSKGVEMTDGCVTEWIESERFHDR